MSTCKRSEINSPPKHMHRPTKRKPTLKQKAVKAQRQSEHYRKVQVTLQPAPWERRNGQ